MGQPRAVVLALIVVVLCNCDLQEAKTLPPWLPWFSYTEIVDNLDHFLKDRAPIGQRNVFLFARKVIISSDIDLTSSYYDEQEPFTLTIVCETLRVERNVDINLSGDKAPDYVSRAPMTVLFQPVVFPWKGRTGANGGSIYIYAKEKTGSGELDIDVSGGKGGKGQAGWNGKDGKDATWLNPAVNGQDGGDGAQGGDGGDAGEIVINSMSNPNSIVDDTVVNGGDGGRGGSGGRGGDGSQGSWTFSGGRAGRTGDRGPSGDDGSSTTAEKNTLSDATAFYRSVPIIGTHLQRALNAEMQRIMLARHYQNYPAEWNLIRDHVMWIKEVAEANGYDVVQERCDHMIDLCNHYEANDEFSAYNVNIPKSAIKEHFDNLQYIIQQSVNIDQDTLDQRIQNDPLMTEHSSYARSFHHLYKRFDKLKDRYENADEVADLFGDVSSRPSSTIHNFLTTSSFSTKLENEVKSIARDIDDDIASALDTAEQGGSVAIDALVIFDALIAGVESAPVLAVLGVERIVGPQIERVAVKALGMRVMSQLHSLNNWGQLFGSIHEALTSYEKAVQTRADNSGRSKRSTAKIRKDQKVRSTARVNRRVPHLRPGRRLRLANGPPTQNMKPKPLELTGKFLGVLDKREEIDGNSNKVVVTFDAIHVLLFVEEGRSLNLNNLDAKQSVELFSQLESYGSPFNKRPSFYVTTTVNEGDVRENHVGEWFQFDCEFNDDGADEAVEFSVIKTLVQNQLSQTFSLVVSDDMTATVSLIRRLSSSLQRKLTVLLQLSTFVNELSRRKKRQVSGSSHNCAGSTSDKITKVDIMNVGQGSCNLLYKDSNLNRVEVVLDLGYGKGRVTGNSENQLIDKISNAPSIIISHWDLDHYRYLAKSSIRILAEQKDITAPSYFGQKPGVTVRRAVRSIPENDLHLVNVGNYQSPMQVHGSNVQNLDLRTTTLTNGRNRNDVGAITAAVIDYNCKPYLLLPGDASYNYVPSQQMVEDYYLFGVLYSHSVGRLKYLVATHHGSTKNIGTIPDGEGNHGYVIYSYGQGNRYGHSVTRARPLYSPVPRPGWNYEYLTAGSNYGVTISLDLTRNVWHAPTRN